MGRNLLHRLYAVLAFPAVVDSVLGLSTPAHFADVLDCVLNCGRLRKGTLVVTMPVFEPTSPPV